MALAKLGEFLRSKHGKNHWWMLHVCMYVHTYVLMYSLYVNSNMYACVHMLLSNNKYKYIYIK